MTLAASRSLSGAGPQTRTSTSVPRAAASSTARRLSSRRTRRSAASTAGNMPPRHRLETRSPASRTMRALSLRGVRGTLRGFFDPEAVGPRIETIEDVDLAEGRADVRRVVFAFPEPSKEGAVHLHIEP